MLTSHLRLMQNIILRVEHIKKTFTPPLSYRDMLRFNLQATRCITALDDVSFNVEKGRVIAVLGPNGAGKTTLLKIISTLVLPDHGQVIVDGRYVVGKDDEKIKALIGLVYTQERNFYWRLTGKQNLEFFASLYGFNKNKTTSVLKNLFELFEVDYAHRRFDSYSTGMKQKFSLIRAMLHDPEILLLDEPTKSLDYATARHFRGFIKEKLVKAQKKTVLLTTHHMDEAAEFCDHFIILDKGIIRAAGSLSELRRRINNDSASIGDIFLKICSQNR